MAEGAVLKCRDHCIPQAVSEAQTQGGNLNMHSSPQFLIKSPIWAMWLAKNQAQVRT